MLYKLKDSNREDTGLPVCHGGALADAPVPSNELLHKGYFVGRDEGDPPIEQVQGYQLEISYDAEVQCQPVTFEISYDAEVQCQPVTCTNNTVTSPAREISYDAEVQCQPVT